MDNLSPDNDEFRPVTQVTPQSRYIYVVNLTDCSGERTGISDILPRPHITVPGDCSSDTPADPWRTS